MKRSANYLILIILGYLLLAVAYALATPPLESSDEYKHYPVVQYVQNQRALPVLDPDDPGLWLQEGAQPPLYYVVMAAMTAWIDTGDLPEVHRVNPHAFVGDPNQVANKNLIIHQPEEETFPWEGSVLAVYVIRFLSILLGVGTIIITFKLGAVLVDETVGLAAAAFTAFNPMFLFVSAAVNNDSLAILLGNLGLFILVLIWREAPDPRRRWSRYAVLGLVLGLAILTKLSLAGLLLLTGLALAWLSWRRRDWRILLAGGGIVLIIALLVTAPWLLRNLREYGDPTALATFIAVQGTRDQAMSLRDWSGEFGTFFRSYWGLFGGVNIAAPQLLYAAYNLLALTGAAGFVVWAWRLARQGKMADRPQEPELKSDVLREQRMSDRGIWLLVAWAAILMILLVRWNIISPSFQGRLLFPSLGALNVLWAIGLLSLLKPAWRPRLAATLAGVFFVVAAILPFVTIRPSYMYPKPLNEVPATAIFGPITFQGEDAAIQLVGVEVLPDQSVQPDGDPIELALYWSIAEHTASNYLTSIHVLGRELVSEGQVNRFPASGMIPTSQWQPGQIWRDEYRLFVDEDARAPSRLLLKVGIYDPVRGRDLPVAGPDGEEIDLLIIGQARLAVQAGKKPKPENKLDAIFEEGLSFQGYTLDHEIAAPGEELAIDLYWEAGGRPSRDYTVFVHLLDPLGEMVVTADGPPVLGDFPTSLWRDGDVIADRHSMILPGTLSPGTYQLMAGFYDPESLVRLKLVDGSGDAVSWPIEIR